MHEKRSLLEVIRENCQNGELPEGFSLPKDDTDPGKMRWADGALDGVGMYHMQRPEITDAQTRMIADALAALPDLEQAKAGMQALFAEVGPLFSIDAIQNYIFSHTEQLDPNAVFALADDCLHSAEVDLVKLGLLLMEIFNEPDAAEKEAIRTLGLSDEFTIFAIFDMATWKDSNQEIFALAQKVHGWGRVHAVARLAPETQEIRDWLLAEGIRNDVLPDYSAHEVYEKAGIAALLKGTVTDAQLGQITAVLSAMFDEGPVMGISALAEAEADEMLGDFLQQAEAHTLTQEIGDLLRRISEDERFSMHAARCTALLERLG